MTAEQRQAALEHLRTEFESAVMTCERAIGMPISKASTYREGDQLNFKVILGSYSSKPLADIRPKG